MVQRHQLVVFCVYLAASAAALAQNSYIFQLPGQTTGSGNQIVGLVDNDFGHRFVSASDPGFSGATKVLATPSGSKFYILTPTGIYSGTPASPTISGIARLGAVSGAATAAEITPDGKYVLVVASHFYIVDTATGSLKVQADTGVPQGGTPVGVAVSHDAQTAWVVSNTSTGSTVTAVNLKTFEIDASINMASGATSLVQSSRGLLYVTTNARLYEVDPVSFSITTLGQISLSGPIGPLQFTPDGNTAYFLNLSVCSSCSPIFRLDVATHSLSSLVSPSDGSSLPSIDRVLVAGNNRVFGWSAARTQLYDITSTPLTLTPSVLGVLPVSNVLAVGVSNEVPSARYLYLLITDHSFYRLSLATDCQNGCIDGAPGSFDPANGTTLSFVPIPAQSGAANILQINAQQTVNPGASTALIAEVVDSVGHPVLGASATFTDATGKITIGTPSSITTAGGWAQTSVTAPTDPGTYSVTLNVGALSPATFQLTVNGSNSGNPGPTPLISIYSGDGQLLRQNDSTISTGLPLIAKVTDAGGNPVANVLVRFQVTQGPITNTVSPVTSLTGADGLAKADFFSGPIDLSLVLSKVTATADTYGSVDFFETTHNARVNVDPQPGYDSLVPALKKLEIPQGSLISGAISVHTFAQTTVGPIPNVGLMLADPANINSPSPIASCVGSSRGDNNGVSRCDVLAACQPDLALPSSFTTALRIGGGGQTPDSLSLLIGITITPGIPSLLTKISGDNATGNPGNSFTLFAKVADGCGQPSTISGLTWTILQGAQGSALLDQTQTSSDNAGKVSTRVTLGQVPGPVRIQLAGPKLTPIIFTITNQVLVSGIFLVSGGGQSVEIGKIFPNPAVFIVRDVSNNPAAGLLVNFSSAGSGAATFNPASATTNAQGQVQTTVTAGATPGDILLTATYKTFTATASLSSHLPGPQVTSASFTNSASGAVGLTPCGLATVIGNGIAPSFSGSVTGGGFTLQGLSITANNVAVPIMSVSNLNGVQSANFQTPCELIPGPATVVVTVNSVSTSVSGVQVLAAQPGVFVVDPVKKYGWVLRPNGSLVTPSNPARQGEHLFAIVTGLGQVTPTAITNVPGAGQDVNLAIGVQIVVNGAAVGLPVPSKRYLAGFIGAYIIEFQLAQGIPAGPDQSLVIAQQLPDGSLVFANTVLIPSIITP